MFFKTQDMSCFQLRGHFFPELNLLIHKLNVMNRFIKLPLIKPQQIAKFNAEQQITFPKKELLFEKIIKMRQTPQQIDIIADFDHTLTQHRLNKEKCDSLFGMFVKHHNLPQNFRKDLLDNYIKYGPFETDLSLTFNERLQYMDTLYTIQRDLFHQHQITADQATQVLEHSNLVYRACVQEFLQEIYKSRIVLHIVSGGISDMIYSSLLKLIDPATIDLSVKIHSNSWKLLDQNANKLLKFQGNIVHSYNKHLVMANYEKRHKNCILMGDLKSDIYMAEHANYETTLSIFYGKQGEFDQRALAQQKFDIIIEGDSSHKMPTELIKIINGRRDVDWRYLYTVSPTLTTLII